MLYEEQARDLFDRLQAGDDAAQWCFKWEHPRFRNRSIDEVRAAALDISDAQLVVAREHAFENWSDLCRFVDTLASDPDVARLEAAVEAVIAGDIETLRTLLNADPDLIRKRSVRRHHGTLLHYIAANGVENHRQRTPKNAVEVATMLLQAGAEADALADMYDERCTTMSMLVSSCHPAEAGLQVALAETLIDYGAALEGAVLTALTFGYLETANALAGRGAPLSLPALAGLGRVDEVARLLPEADAASRQIALALAAQHGHVAVVRLLLENGEDPNRYNPEHYHSHATPLHHAVLGNHSEVVKVLVEHGARLDIKDTIYSGTPLDWAIYGQRSEIAEYLTGCANP